MATTTAAPRFPVHDFLGLPLTDTGREGLVRWLVDPDPATVAPRAAAYLNAHTANLALRKEGALSLLLPRFDLIYADGMSVVRETRRRGFPVSERVSAADFFPQFCWSAAERGRRIALIGGVEGLADKCAAAMKENIPQLDVVLAHTGILTTGSKVRGALLDRLRAERPDITLIGMGSPRQEALALELRAALHLPTVWCVGALFEYYAPGVRRHAPEWMRNAGLEWLFRLGQEPRRLAGRYILGNAEFLWRARFGGRDR